MRRRLAGTLGTLLLFNGAGDVAIGRWGAAVAWIFVEAATWSAAIWASLARQPKLLYAVLVASIVLRVFVMGDNRDNSHDSRFRGGVPLDHLKGTALFVWWSSGEQVRTDRIGAVVE